MTRRPLPIVLLAALQFISPIIYLLFAAFHYDLSLIRTTNEVFAFSTPLRLFEIFLLPIVLGFLILITRKLGYRIVIAGSVYLIIRSIVSFVSSNDTDPILPIVFSNLLCVGVLIYFVRPHTREIYFNPKLRWWEHNPRYILNVPATMGRVGAKPVEVKLQNLALGGAGIEIAESKLLMDEVIDLGFQYQGVNYLLKSRLVWQRSIPDGPQYLGFQWADSSDSAELSKIRRLVRALKQSRTPTTRPVGHFWENLKGRFYMFTKS